uniref:(northern house mosquito) hypothetical protein n=1 Tax=Culex pipiens TaxID=7175 RepID=A0A8D8K4J2_CULPI
MTSTVLRFPREQVFLQADVLDGKISTFFLLQLPQNFLIRSHQRSYEDTSSIATNLRSFTNVQKCRLQLTPVRSKPELLSNLLEHQIPCTNSQSTLYQPLPGKIRPSSVGRHQESMIGDVFHLDAAHGWVVLGHGQGYRHQCQ